MSYQEACELALLRQKLREFLSAADPMGARSPLARLAELVGSDLELRAEYERWSFRFEILGCAA